MSSTILVAIVFATLLAFAAKKAISDIKKGKCAGCSACDTKTNKTCDIKF